jgi:hypothetical protein
MTYDDAGRVPDLSLNGKQGACTRLAQGKPLKRLEWVNQMGAPG